MPTDQRSLEQLWFLNTQVILRIRHSDGTDGLSVLEHRVPFGDSPPLHIHRNEDEVFHVLEGELRFLAGGREVRARAGDSVLTVKGVPHTYRAESQEGARFLTIVRGGDFEGLVRALGRPAERDGLPDAAGPPSPEQAQALAEACLRHGVELVGPPLG
ncbi:cupin domain-containing protein [Falsiroseomonas tokyonensis]|uniref:Cupin domain-containing protein n=1 Tax=Falsiroseomonas tokyonensis TaxID=430521 RepID=A0ABV7BQA3_9PROT|nr:cupin domain-containing protein [Falsiroseomonas tokyonensis]MBU8536240.1 cupin domain-containing protein [Falsiroseomonas tokyonensis]